MLIEGSCRQIVNFVLLAASLPPLFMVVLRVKASNYGQEDDVAPPLDWEKAVGRGGTAQVASEQAAPSARVEGIESASLDPEK